MSTDRDRDVHDRTHRLAKLIGLAPEALRNLVGRSVLLEVDAAAATSEAGRLAFLTLCNLATRLGPYVPHLDIAAPAGLRPLASTVYPTGSSLAEQAIWVVRAAIPTEHLIRDIADPGRTYDIAISIGAPSFSARERIRVGWQNWLALVGGDDDSLPVDGEQNPFGAMLAAGMATARLHALQVASIGARVPDATGVWRLNALTLTDGADGPRLPDSVPLPRLLLVGAGALGSSLAYALSHVPGLRANGDAVDPDVLKPSNANRQITAPFERARDEKTHKVDDLAVCWPALTPFRERYDRFKERQGRDAGAYEIAVTAADNGDARREVATDLPRVLIDGATGGLMIALMRGTDPAHSCVACEYPRVVTDEDGVWRQRLGVSRDRVVQLRTGAVSFTDEILAEIKERGTLQLDARDEDALRRDGWKHLVSGQCGNARPDRDLPSASVSYVSAICGFLMAAQVLSEALGMPALDGARPRWVWADVLREPPQAGQRVEGSKAKSCADRHELRSRIYRDRWRQQP